MASGKKKKTPVKKGQEDGKKWFLTILLLATIFILGFLIAFFQSN